MGTIFKLVGFQFLIGRLGTDGEDYTSTASSGFQFLIGRLGTHIVHIIFVNFFQFQFLIGRLGTFIAGYRPILQMGFNSS